MAGDLGDLSKDDINSQYRERIKDSVGNGNWPEASKYATMMKKNSERMGPKYFSEADRVYKDVKGHMNPYESRMTFSFSLVFVALALGGLLLLGNITGNVVGAADIGTGLVGAVLFALGVVGALVLIRRK